MRIASSISEKIANEILTTNDDILSISIIDKKGNILAAISKESFKEDFGIT